MNNQLLTKKDIEYSNLNFWYYYIFGFRGFDDKKELNLDDAIREVVDIKKHTPDFKSWYKDNFPKEKADKDGLFESPRTIAGKLTENMSFAIEFHLSEITFYINTIYVGNLGGHFEAWFLTFKELIAFNKYEKLFMLLLPMTGIEESEREYAESLVSENLKQISMFAEHADYIAKCIVNGLIIEEPFYNESNIGIVCNTNHSVRNITKYPHYKEDVIELNEALKSFVENSNN
ncbi:Imm19 family immunity protein [Dysgonomonas sp. 25]|uniref:Imm19 family immunity protein n=1 Tax=Dysgonomonas sp. 25 TaxID=2302933 RepID=UPI0013D43F20|nr:Imm19 family immunity protein [Dysgonomonas sp. 25]NDV68287.1 hypothetical protein [Dysgonomonas sp. 25]